MVISKAEFDIFTLRKHKGVNGWTTKAAGAGPDQRIQTKISKPDRTKDNIFLKPKDDRAVWRAGWMTVGGWIQEA